MNPHRRPHPPVVRANDKVRSPHVQKFPSLPPLQNLLSKTGAFFHSEAEKARRQHLMHIERERSPWPALVTSRASTAASSIPVMPTLPKTARAHIRQDTMHTFKAESHDDVKSSLARFDATLRQRTDKEKERVKDMNAAKSYSLLRALFQLNLSDQFSIVAQIREMGEEVVRTRIRQIVQRFGLRQMTPDDFHGVMVDVIVPSSVVTRAECQTLFDLFDANRSGIVDQEECLDGIHSLLQDRSTLTLLFLRKLVMEPRSMSDVVMSLHEVNMLFRSVCEFYELHPNVAPREIPSVQKLQDNIRVVFRRLEMHSHHGEVAVPFLRKSVLDEPMFIAAVKAIPADGIVAVEPKAPRVSPDPDEVLAKIRGEDKEKPLRRRRSRIGMEDLDSFFSRPNARSSVGSVFGSSATTGDSTVDMRNPRFKGDAFKVADADKQVKAAEKGNPQWYSIGGQVWKVLEGEQPTPVV